MKILFLRSNPVDPDSRVEKEVEALADVGHTVEIFAWDRRRYHDFELDQLSLGAHRIPVTRVGVESKYSAGFKKNLVPLAAFEASLSSFLKCELWRFDVVHACDFDTAYVASKWCRRLHKLLVYDIFDYYVDSFSVPGVLKGFVEGMDRRLIDCADATIICTERRAEQIAGASPQRLTVVHNSPGVPNWLASFEGPTTSERVRICYVGVLSKGRDISGLLDFVASNEGFELHIGGFGLYENDVCQYAERCGNIFFYGKVSYAETLRLEASCDILVAMYDPSIRNHFFAAPNKFYEGLMLGKPLVMARGSGMSDIVEQERLGFVCEYGDVGSGLINARERRSEWEAISDCERHLYRSRYSWNVMKKRLVHLYDELEKSL